MGTDFTNAGHFVALLIGIVLSIRFGPSARWTKFRIALLVVGGAFCYLVLVNTGFAFGIAPIAGFAGAMAAHWLAGRWRVRRARPVHAVAAAATT
jgi:hypothetical protein